jgi:glycolate oxidase FAD binding subunit
VKNVAGFDMTRLCVGSWGTLGLITSISARLFPTPEEDVTLVYRCDTVRRLLSAAREVSSSATPFAAVELFDPLPPAAAAPETTGESEAEPGLLVRLLGPKARVVEMEGRLERDLAGGLGNPTRMAGSASRNLHRTLEGWEADAELMVRMSLLPSELPTLVEESKALGILTKAIQQQGWRSRVASCPGSGLLRFGIWGSLQGQGPPDWEPWVASLREVRARLEEKGGSLVVSRGPGELVREVGAWGERGEGAFLMDGLKACFDPHGILAPGRLGL